MHELILAICEVHNYNVLILSCFIEWLPLLLPRNVYTTTIMISIHVAILKFNSNNISFHTCTKRNCAAITFMGPHNNQADIAVFSLKTTVDQSSQQNKIINLSILFLGSYSDLVHAVIVHTTNFPLCRAYIYLSCRPGSIGPRGWVYTSIVDRQPRARLAPPTFCSII